MKNIFKKLFWALPVFSLVVACSPDEPLTLDGTSLPSAASASINISVVEDSVVFSVDNKNVVPVWIFSAQDRVSQNGLSRKYTLPNTYTVYVKLYNKNGISADSVKKDFVVASTPTLKNLAGTGTKTWKWDYTVKGHIGCGPSGTTGLGWWSANPNDKAGTGMYDDELTFTSDMKYNFSPGADGKIYVNKDSKYKPEFYKNDGLDYDAPCSVLNTTFTFQQTGKDVYLVFPQNTMLSYIPNPEAMSNPKYKVIALTSTLLELVVDNGGIAWHYRFKPKASK